MGHDPAYLVPLCDPHHVARHEQRFVIEIGSDGPQFKLVDGTPFECSRAHDPSGGEAARMAVAALQKLELGAREARACVDRALAQPRAEPWTVEELLRAALRLHAG